MTSFLGLYFKIWIFFKVYGQCSRILMDFTWKCGVGGILFGLIHLGFPLLHTTLFINLKSQKCQARCLPTYRWSWNINPRMDINRTLVLDTNHQTELMFYRAVTRKIWCHPYRHSEPSLLEAWLWFSASHRSVLFPDPEHQEYTLCFLPHWKGNKNNFKCT